jgi:hypothetical protein
MLTRLKHSCGEWSKLHQVEIAFHTEFYWTAYMSSLMLLLTFIVHCVMVMFQISGLLPLLHLFLKPHIQKPFWTFKLSQLHNHIYPVLLKRQWSRDGWSQHPLQSISYNYFWSVRFLAYAYVYFMHHVTRMLETNAYVRCLLFDFVQRLLTSLTTLSWLIEWAS